MPITVLGTLSLTAALAGLGRMVDVWVETTFSTWLFGKMLVGIILMGLTGWNGGLGLSGLEGWIGDQFEQPALDVTQDVPRIKGG